MRALRHIVKATGLATAFLAAWAAAASGQAEMWTQPFRCMTEPPAGDGLWEDAWPGGLVYYEFDPMPSAGSEITPAQRQIVLDAMAAIEAVSSIRFIERTTQPNWIRFRRQDAPFCGCCGYSTHIGIAGGMQSVVVSSCAWTYPLLVHEIGHALGLWHEQQRPDRNQFIDVILSRVEPGLESNFAIVPAQPSGIYDFASAMHYHAATFSVRLPAIEVKQPYRRFWQSALEIDVRAQAIPLSLGDRWTLADMYGPVDLPPRTFTLLQPAPNAAVGPAWAPEFTWQPAEGAESYRLQVDDDLSFSSPEIDIATAMTSYSASAPLAPGSLFFWRVTASNAHGETRCFHVPWQALYTASSYPTILFVDDSAPVGGDGSSWVTPMRDLKIATEVAYAADGQVSEVRVGQGVYRPDLGSGDRTMSFHVAEGCALKGGYAGYGAPDPDARNVAAYETILSGDLLGNDGPGFAGNAENSYHVVRIDAAADPTLLDGFTITGGNANGPPAAGPFNANSNGAGVFASLDAPVISNCLIKRNSALVHGGGATMWWNSGGALDACRFVGNQSLDLPGWGFGGGLSLQFTGPEQSVHNCLFAENFGELACGGAVAVNSAATFANCTFANNAGGLLGGGAFGTVWSCDTTLTNCILWDDLPGGRELVMLFFDLPPSRLTVRYSDVEGGKAGARLDPGQILIWDDLSNISADPLFLALGGDYRAAAGSPVIDAGDSAAVPAGVTTDLAGLPRFVGVVDMGAYEFQRCYADCDGSGSLDFFDFLCFQNLFAAGAAAADCDESGTLDFFDFLCFQNAFAAGCP
jgi:hypothetical protein